MDLRNVIIAFVALANIFIFLLVYFRSPRLSSVRFFRLSIVAVFFWCFSMVAYRYFAMTGNSVEAILWARCLYAAASTIPLSFLLHSLTFPDKRVPKKALLFAVIFGAAYVGLNLFTNLIVKGVDLSPAGEKVIVFNWLYYWTYPLVIAVPFSASFYFYLRALRVVSGVFKYQLQILITGLAISTGVGMVANLWLPTVGNFTYNWAGQVMTSVWSAVIGYAIAKHRFVDFKLIVVRSLSYVLALSFMVAGLGLLVISVTNQLFDTQRSPLEFMFLISLFVLVVIVYEPIKSGFARLTDKIFHSKPYDLKELFEEFSLATVTHLSMDGLSKSVSSLLREKLKSSFAQLLVLDGEKSTIWKNGTVEASRTDDVSNALQKLLQTAENRKKTIIVQDEVLDNSVRDAFQIIDAGLILRLVFRKKLMGLLILGEKTSGSHYTDEDIEAIELLGPELGMALANSLAYQEISDFNITLKQEVDKATESLKDANLRLRQLDKLKDEFVSLASHELRTPMVSIHNYTWMLLNDKAGPLKPKQKEYIRRIHDSSSRLSRLVNSMLNISRIESGRVVLSVERADLHKLVANVVRELAGKAENQGVKLVIESVEKLPTVLVDVDKVTEVLVNFVGNSLKFTKPGGVITISFHIDPEFVQVRVQDTGVGLTKAEIPQLFKKFGMIKESYLQTTGIVQGTGLGLYICKSIIKMHGGTVGVESEGRGKGSTFYFTVPRQNTPMAKELEHRASNSNNVGIIRTDITNAYT